VTLLILAVKVARLDGSR